MPIKNSISAVPLSTIKLDQSIRQRTELDSRKLLELAQAITTNQWINPILYDLERGVLIVGGRRYTAVEALAAALADDWSKFGELADEAKSVINPACPVASWENWTKIPAQAGSKITDLELMVFEWSENYHREDLSWQDKAAALHKIHLMAWDEARKAGKQWSDGATASMLSMSQKTFSRHVSPIREVESAPTELKPKLQKHFEEARSPDAAKQALSSVLDRHGHTPRAAGKGAVASFGIGKTSKPAAPPPVEDDSRTAPILCTDFISWAAEYSGPAFNFAHIDFPYGIRYNEGGNFDSSSATIEIGEYDDSPEVYWSLIQALIDNKDRILTESSHVMFWFSQNLRRETEDVFRAAGFDIKSHLMLWVHPAKQTTPDPTRYGQRNYESAMLLTLGDRKVVRPKQLAFVHNHETTKRHRSEKPLPVLSHFFEMFVDDSTRMLDPACGSATSLLAAKKQKAASVLGLELDPEMAAASSKFYLENV